MKSSPSIVQVWGGLDVVNTVRILCGITKAREADAGSIRGDLAMSIQCNVIHASDSIDAAKIEIARFFTDKDLFSYDKSEWFHVYADDERAKLSFEAGK